MFLFTYAHNSMSKWSAVKSRFQCDQKATISCYALLKFLSLRASLSAAAWRGALSCASLDVRELTYISFEKSLCSSLWECVGVGRARQSEQANERVRGTGKQACSSQRTDAHPVQREWRERDPGLSVPCLVIRPCPGLTTTRGYFFKVHGNCTRWTNSASPLYGSLGEGQQFLRVQHLLTASFASGVVFRDSRGGRDSLAPKVQKYKIVTSSVWVKHQFLHGEHEPHSLLL